MRASRWLSIGEGNSNGVLDLEVTYRTGTGSSKDHLPKVNPVLAPVLGCSGQGAALVQRYAGALWSKGLCGPG